MKPKTKTALVKYLKSNPNLECAYHWRFPHLQGAVSVVTATNQEIAFTRGEVDYPEYLTEQQKQDWLEEHTLNQWKVPKKLYWMELKQHQIQFDELGFAIVHNGKVDLRYEYRQ